MKNLQSNVLMNLPLMKILIHLVLQNKRSNHNTLEDNITTLKGDMIVVKNFMMQEIINITQRIKNVAWKICRDEVDHLKEENNSKNEIILRSCPKIFLVLLLLQKYNSNVERWRKYQVVLMTCSIKFHQGGFT